MFFLQIRLLPEVVGGCGRDEASKERVNYFISSRYSEASKEGGRGCGWNNFFFKKLRVHSVSTETQLFYVALYLLNTIKR